MCRASNIKLLICIALCVLQSACVSSPQPHSSVIKTLRATAGAGPFGNVLVVSAAGDRESRVRVEQELSAAISDEGAVATAFFAVAGRYSPISRNVLDNAVRTRGFDAILLVRRQGQERPDLAPNRPTGRKFDLYHYDYEELNDLLPINVDSTVTFVAEVYDTAGAKKIWAIDSLIFESDSVTTAVSAQVANIAGELQKDRVFRQ